MPKYEYKCNICGSIQELERSIHEEADAPICCQQVMSRVWSSTPIHFKTGGFYSTGG